MTDEQQNVTNPEAMEQLHAGEHEPGQLTKQTEGMDAGVTRAIAGPEWDPDLVREANESMGGQPLEGEIETGPQRSSGTGGTVDSNQAFDAEDTDR